MQDVWFGVRDVGHHIFGCTIMDRVQCTDRHACNHQNPAYKHWLITGKCPVYRYERQPTPNSSSYSMYCIWTGTDHHMPHNKPEMLLVDKTGRFAYIIYVAILKGNTEYWLGTSKKFAISGRL